MSLTNSPQFEDGFEETFPEQLVTDGGSLEPQPSPPRRWTRALIVGLTLLIMIGGLLLVLRQGSPPVARVGSAAIHGQIVNLQGTGVPDAVVFVEGMNSSVTTGEGGVFSITGAPDGILVIVVGVTPEAPQFATFSVGVNTTNDLGQIVYQP